MSWFRRTSHRLEQTRPHHTSPIAEELQREIEQNREQLQQHRESVGKNEKSKMMGKS